MLQYTHTSMLERSPVRLVAFLTLLVYVVGDAATLTQGRFSSSIAVQYVHRFEEAFL
jgi:hypothetical protein